MTSYIKQTSLVTIWKPDKYASFQMVVQLQFRLGTILGHLKTRLVRYSDGDCFHIRDNFDA
jgi:hypothetical protein